MSVDKTSRSTASPPAASVATLRSWLASLLPEGVPAWEVTPDTIAVLTALHARNTAAEADTKLLVQTLRTAAAEYAGEQERLAGVLAGAGPGVEDSLRQGPAHSYAENIVGVCSALGRDSCGGAGLQLAVTDLLVKQTLDTAELAKQRNNLDSLKTNVVGLYEKLAKSEDELEKAGRIAKDQAETLAIKNKKIEFMGKKCIQYKRDIEKKEAILSKNGGNDPSVKHEEIVNLKKRTDSLEETLAPLSRQLQGYLSLPPSVELARVELAKLEMEHEELEKKVSGSISNLHL